MSPFGTLVLVSEADSELKTRPLPVELWCSVEVAEPTTSRVWVSVVLTATSVVDVPNPSVTEEPGDRVWPAIMMMPCFTTISGELVKTKLDEETVACGSRVVF